VESSCACGNDPSGPINAGQFLSGCRTNGLSSSDQLHRVSYSVTSNETNKRKDLTVLSQQQNTKDIKEDK
jgi:hypothetical protein